jgi:D-cysteine desulfhydrase
MSSEGIPMDTTYVGKAFCGMQNYLREKKITGKNILFIHTGGTPLYFDHLKGLS